MAKTQFRYPRDYINFMSDLDVSPDNKVVANIVDQESPFISRYYTPHIQVSELGRKVYEEIKKRNIRLTSQQPIAPSLSNNILYGNVLKHYPRLTELFKIVFLESFALIYIQNEDSSFTRYLNIEDLNKVRETVKYLVDIIGLDPRYTTTILYLHDVDAAFGVTARALPHHHGRGS